MTGCSRQLLPSDFELIVHRELSTTNTYKERAEQEMSSSSRTSTEHYQSPIESPVLVSNNNLIEKNQRYNNVNSNNLFNCEFKKTQQDNNYETNNQYLLNKSNYFNNYNYIYYSNNSF